MALRMAFALKKEAIILLKIKFFLRIICFLWLVKTLCQKEKLEADGIKVSGNKVDLEKYAW